MSDFVYTPCLKRYFTDIKGMRWQLNAIPFRKNASNADYSLYFPRPFTIVGFVTLDNAVSPTPTLYYPNVFSKLANAATHAANAPAPIYIFLDLAYANCIEFSLSNPINYIGPGPQATDWRGYFSKWLNQDASSISESEVNSIIQPGSLMDMFFTKNSAIAADVWFERWKDMIKTIELTCDPNLLGAPGVYGISVGTAIGTPTWDGQTEYTYQFAA